eukprot:1158095-Pelagomonas_calceolata.AAC.9
MALVATKKPGLLTADFQCVTHRLLETLLEVKVGGQLQYFASRLLCVGAWSLVCPGSGEALVHWRVVPGVHRVWGGAFLRTRQLQRCIDA